MSSEIAFAEVKFGRDPAHRLADSSGLDSKHPMKRIAQFAAVLAIALLVAQPAIAGATCLFGPAAACVSGCPMAGMGPDCPMTGQTVASSCPMDCCSHAALQATDPQVAPSKVRVVVQPIAFAEHYKVSIANPIAVAREIVKIRSVSPPRYILNRAFRI